MAFKNFNEILSTVEGKRKRLAIADPSGSEVIHGVLEAYSRKIIEPILVGDRTKIEPLIAKTALAKCKIVHCSTPQDIAFRSVELVRQKKADLIMKGKLSTATLLKAVLDKKTGIRSGKLLSHISLVEVPSYSRLLIFTDGGMVIKPDVKQKAEIIRNAIYVAKN